MLARVACIVALLAAVVFAAGARAADEAGLPLRVPAGWQPVFADAHGRVLVRRISVWKTPGYHEIPSGFFLGYTERGAADDPQPYEAGQQSVRCGTTVELKRSEDTDNPAATMIHESQRFELDGVPFEASYIYPSAKRDAQIERIMNVVCPADLPYAVPPPGWERSPESGDRGIALTFAPPLDPAASTDASASLALYAFGANGDALTPADLAFLNHSTNLFPKPMAFHRTVARPACGVPLYLAQSDVSPSTTTYVRAAISKYHGRLYVALLTNENVLPNAEQLAAIGSLCAQRPLQMQWLLPPIPSPSPSPSPSPAAGDGAAEH